MKMENKKIILDNLLKDLSKEKDMDLYANLYQLSKETLQKIQEGIDAIKSQKIKGK